jgi:hypothetical protein
MPIVSIVIGLLLSGLGAYCYVAADPEHKSVTATIPAWAGALLILCWAIAMKESLLKHAMHAAAAIGLIGFLGGAVQFGRVMLGAGLADARAVNKAIASGGMAALCLVFVALCVNSFIQVRRARARAAGAGSGGSGA